MQSKRKNLSLIYFAFPGLGKTTYALQNSAVIDLDFGNLRSAFKVKKEEEHTLLLPFSRLVNYYLRDGYDVLTNEPSLLPYVKQFAEGRIKFVLPVNQTELVERVRLREENRNVNKDFPIALSKNISVWINQWKKCAEKYHVPVVYVKYFEEAI